MKLQINFVLAYCTSYLLLALNRLHLLLQLMRVLLIYQPRPFLCRAHQIAVLAVEAEIHKSKQIKLCNKRSL